MFKRVVQEVDERLLKGAAIDDWPRAESRELSLINLDRDRHLPFCGVRLHQPAGLLDQRDHVGRFELVFFPALFNAGEIQDVLDERGKPLNIPAR